ncbi:hypothetical protein M0802_015847 [Mischocyttarus mexicanus]|nr:hypothetical protein M0802_015847 [Mischocyttarus mexicanus]
MALEKNPKDFPTETRASLVDDVFALAAVGSLKYETAFGFIKYMQMKERHYAPWNAFAHHVFKLNNILYESSVLLEFQLHNFWDNNYESIKTVKYAAALVESKSNFAISLINNYSDDIKKWLKDNNNDSGP